MILKVFDEMELLRLLLKNHREVSGLAFPGRSDGSAQGQPLQMVAGKRKNGPAWQEFRWLSIWKQPCRWLLVMNFEFNIRSCGYLVGAERKWSDMLFFLLWLIGDQMHHHILDHLQHFHNTWWQTWDRKVFCHGPRVSVGSLATSEHAPKTYLQTIGGLILQSSLTRKIIQRRWLSGRSWSHMTLSTTDPKSSNL